MRHFDVVSQEVNGGQEFKNIAQPKRLSTEKNKIDDRFKFSDQESYDDFKARHKYNRSERKDLIRLAKRIYIQ